jgi:hypothetical protein
MKYLPRIVALVACSSVPISAPEVPMQRDGVWLQNGISQYARFNARGDMSEQETNEAMVVTSYVCAVVDLEKYLVQRANLLAAALEDGGNKSHLDPQMLDGMAESLPILVPLMKTHFLTDSPSCFAVFLIVRDYLGKYPEVLTKHAEVVVENALLDAYPNTNEP